MVFLRTRRMRYGIPNPHLNSRIHENKTEIIVFKYYWAITDFWETYDNVTTLNSGYENKQPFTFRMVITEHGEKLKFYAIFHRKERKQRAFSYYIFLKTAKGRELCKTGFEWYPGKRAYLHEIYVSNLFDDKYVPDGQFTIYFRFNIFRNVLPKSNRRIKIRRP